MVGGEGIQRDRQVAQLLHDRAVADDLGGLVEVDRLVVADVGLRRGREDRLGQLLGLPQALGQGDPRDGARRLVVLPARAGDVAAHDALDGQHLELAHVQRPAAHLVGHVLGDRHEVVRHDVPRLVEPEGRQRGQHLALVGNRCRMHDVVRRDPVRGDHQDAVAEVVHLADLAGGQQREGFERRHPPQATNGRGEIGRRRGRACRRPVRLSGPAAATGRRRLLRGVGWHGSGARRASRC